MALQLLRFAVHFKALPVSLSIKVPLTVYSLPTVNFFVRYDIRNCNRSAGECSMPSCQPSDNPHFGSYLQYHMDRNCYTFTIKVSRRLSSKIAISNHKFQIDRTVRFVSSEIFLRFFAIFRQEWLVRSLIH